MPAVAQGVSRPLSYVCNPVGVACAARRVHHQGMEKSMDANQAAATESELDLDTWDWARTAGVSAEQLLQALRAAFDGPELLQAA